MKATTQAFDPGSGREKRLFRRRRCGGGFN
jgi:hypothetical protein